MVDSTRRPFSFDLTASSPVVSAIIAHQNPADCTTASYLVHSLAWRQNGLGSSLHILTAMLAHAMNVGRVLIVAQDLAPCDANTMTFQASGSRQWPWADAALCPSGGGIEVPSGRGLVCLLESISRCTPYVNARRHSIKMVPNYLEGTLSHAGPLVSSKVVCDGRGVCPFQLSRPAWLAPYSKREEHAVNYAGWWVAKPPLCMKPKLDASAHALQVNGSVPRHVLVPLERPPSKKGKWRAHAIEYLVRPSAASRAYLSAQYTQFWHGHEHRAARTPPRRTGMPSSVAAPRPEELVAVHIRWGDQATTQMGSVPVSGYIDAVRWLQRRAIRRGLPPPTSVLLTSEDARAIAAFRAAAPRAWRVYAHDYVRHAALADLSRPSAALARMGPTSLFQLFLALEANSFICTSGSNWCRLVNELRKTRIDPSCRNCTTFVDLCGGEW